MALAENSADQKRMSKQRGVKMPAMSPGMNKYPPGNMTVSDDERRETSQVQSNDPGVNSDDDATILDIAKKRFNNAMSIESSNRTQGIEDLKFLNSEQWKQADASARAAEGRPCITENRLPTFVNQITNDQRQNRPSIDISPMGDKASIKDAKMLRGMIRAIERDSNADVAYDTGFASAVHNGWGYWRVVTEYESDSSFNKVIAIKPIANPMNVVLDPNRTQYKLDSTWGIVSEMVAKDEFKRDYPHASITGWNEQGIGQNSVEWMTDKEIRVAEYYYFIYKKRILIALDNGHQGWEDELDAEIAAQVKSGKIEVLAKREVLVPHLKWCKLTSIEVLERQDCDGSYVPIIECDGTVYNINGDVVKKGVVRDAKGPQLMANYYSTMEAEHVALQPKAPWVIAEGQIEGHEAQWNQANKKSFSYLVYKQSDVDGKPAPPPQRQAFNGAPEGIMAAKQGTVEALKAVTGIRFDATMSERMKDESGRAIRELNNNANLGAYHYIDNYARALKNTAIVIVDLIPPTYDTKRIVSVLGIDDKEERVMIDPNMQMAHAEVIGRTPDHPGEDATVKLFNPRVGRYQVTATIGPSYATRRIEAADSQMNFMKSLPPEKAALIPDLIAKNMDFEGAEEISLRLAKALPAGMLSADQGDMPPQTQALVQSLQKQIQDMGQQMELLNKELTDRQKDREVINLQTVADYEAKMDKNKKDLEASVLDVAQRLESAQMQAQAKSEQHIQSTIGRKLGDVMGMLQALQQAIPQAAMPAAPPSTPEQPPMPPAMPGGMPPPNLAANPTGGAPPG